jgi:hypothetical protein
MSGKPRSLRQAQSLLAGQLRAQGRTWAQIAADFRAAYRVNARVALRQAHGWSQPQAAARWTARWPDDPKTFKNFSYWELWPGGTGHAPSLDTLDRLAQLYECSVTDLLSDCSDYGTPPAPRGAATGPAPGGHRDRKPAAGPDRMLARSTASRESRGSAAPSPAVTAVPSRPVQAASSPAVTAQSAASPQPPLARSPDAPSAASAAAPPAAAPPAAAPPAATPQAASSRPSREAPAPSLQAALERIRTADLSELRHGYAGDAGPGLRLKHRMLLLEASGALAVVAAAPVLEIPRRAAAAAGGSPRTDLAVMGYTADVVAGLRRLGGAVGPRATLPPAMALRASIAAMGRNAPEAVTAKALAIYGDLTQLVGWLMFNLGDRSAARYYYDDARSAADRAGNADLVTYALSASSQLAIAMGDPRNAIDHSHAAQRAARRSGSPFAVAYAADVTARAYAAAGQVARCQAALDREQAALGEIGPETPRAPWWYFYDRSFYWGTECECALRLGMAVDASDAARRSLGLMAPVNLHNSALTLAFQAEALIKQGATDEACQTLADAARLTMLNSSRRISRRIERLRERLRPADGTTAVRELDGRLAAFRLARVASEPA